MGALAGGGWSLTDPDRRQAFVANASDVAVEVGIMRERAPQEGDHWRQCDDARAAGTAPVYRGEPGHRDGWDGARDGISCEPYDRRSAVEGKGVTVSVCLGGGSPRTIKYTNS